MNDQYDYFLVRGKERINKETGEVIRMKTKKLRHPLPTGNDKVDSNQSLRDYSLQRGIKANSSHSLSLSMLDEALSKFKEPVLESVKVLKLINKIKYMNRVFISKEELLILLEESANNLNRHLKRLTDYGVIQYEWSSLTAEYMITVNPSIFFKGDDAYKALYEESWLYTEDESPLVSDRVINKTLSDACNISVEEADKFHQESIERSKLVTTNISIPRQVLHSSDIDYAIKIRSDRCQPQK